MSLIEAHKTKWDWKTILNVPLNDTHKTTWRGLLSISFSGMVQRSLQELPTPQEGGLDTNTDYEPILVVNESLNVILNDNHQMLKNISH